MEKKDISSLFKSTGQSLERNPSGDAWERLEARLDEDKEKRRVLPQHWLSVAASVAVLLVAAVYFYTNFQEQKTGIAYYNSPAKQDFDLEPISAHGSTSEEEKGFYRVVEFQRKYQDRLSNPSFQEGARKRLAVSASYRSVPEQKSIGQFLWLLGQWKGTDERIVLDEWQQSGNERLDGRGFGHIDGEVVFLERMRLQQIGQQLYFMVDLFGAEDLLKYKLISYDGRQAIFENPKAPFPNQVVFNRSALNTFELVMQHTSSQPPSEAQVEHLKVRNKLQNEQRFYRKMRKLN